LLGTLCQHGMLDIHLLGALLCSGHVHASNTRAVPQEKFMVTQMGPGIEVVYILYEMELAFPPLVSL
jgi:hypothetical protein